MGNSDVGFLSVRSISTVTLKFQDNVVVGKYDDGASRFFKHPALQAGFMFFGEALCLIPYFIFKFQKVEARSTKKRKTKQFDFKTVLMFALPAMCDATATTLLNIGLFYTYTSTFQMLRGTIVLYAGIFTLIVVRRKLYIHHWMGMAFIVTGAAVVGAASVIYKDKSDVPPLTDLSLASLSSSLLEHTVSHRGLLGVADSFLHGQPVGDVGNGERLREWSAVGQEGGAIAPLFGDIMIFLAQIFAALQFILEEKYLTKFRVEPLLAVGIEGAWGLLLCIFALPMLTVLKDSSGHPIDNGIAAMEQVAASRELQLAILISVSCVGLLNFFGLQITKALSGASRATIDACRTLFVWIFSISIGWERFHLLQVGGFILLVSGTSLYNEVISICLPQADYTAESVSSASDDEDSETDSLLDAENGAPNGNSLDEKNEAAGYSGKPKPKHSALIRIKPLEEEQYTMARSWNLGFNALNPKPLDAVPGDDASTCPSNFEGGSPRSPLDAFPGVDASTCPSILEGGSPRPSSNASSYPSASLLASNSHMDIHGMLQRPTTEFLDEGPSEIPGAYGLAKEDSTILVGSLTSAFAVPREEEY
eukprot:gene22126-29187_t